MKFPKLLAALACSLLTACASTPSVDFIGSWQGEAVTDAERTRLLLQIEGDAQQQQAYITLLDVGVARWPAKSLSGDDQSITVTIPSDSGNQTLQLSRQGDQLVGSWQESRFEELARVQLASVTQQSPTQEQRLLIDGPAGVLGASFLLPNNCTACPGVVFLHGSGPQPRDASRFAAQALAKHGIASVIFDKRGVAESTGDMNTASFEDLAADAQAVADFLKKQPQISKVGFCGHSQGGWVAPLAAANWPHSAFVITSAGPAVSPGIETQWELVDGMQKAGLGEPDTQQARQIVTLWHDGIRSGDWQPFDEAVAAVKGKPWYKGLAYFRRRPSSDFIASYRLTMDYQPLPVLKELKVPMLAMLSPDDESIDAKETAAILQQLIQAGNDLQLEMFPGYDHSLRSLGANGELQRWPNQPANLYELQAAFILAR
jgi:pimeloyl-ACP methyl ester carboxylesterase